MTKKNRNEKEIKLVDGILKETDRFVERALLFRHELEAGGFIPSSSKLAALKRTSMDLSKLLVGIRKPIEY